MANPSAAIDVAGWPFFSRLGTGGKAYLSHVAGTAPGAGCQPALPMLPPVPHASRARRLGDSLAVELPALTRPALVRIQVPQPHQYYQRLSRCARGSWRVVRTSGPQGSGHGWSSAPSTRRLLVPAARGGHAGRAPWSSRDPALPADAKLPDDRWPYRERLTEPPDLAEADKGAAEGGEGLVDVGSAFTAHGKATHAVQPGVGALDHPAVTAKALAALHAAGRDAGLDAAGAAVAA